MIHIYCQECNYPNDKKAVLCAKCRAGVRLRISDFYKTAISEKSTASFRLSLIPPSSLVVFALFLAAKNATGSFFDNDVPLFLAQLLFVILFFVELLLMLFLGLTLYGGAYIISIFALILGIMGLKGEKKIYAIIGIIISILNFSVPFLVSPVNELFLR